MATPSDQPGWRPDPEQPGMVRWWNGLGWSDARRTADATMDRVRDAAQNAVRGSTITPQEVARTNADPRTLRGVPAAAGRASNSLAGAAVGLGVAGFIVGLYGVLPLIALVVSLGGLVRSRRLAASGVKRTGFGQSLVGLVLALIGLVRWIPALVALLPSVSTS